MAAASSLPPAGPKSSPNTPNRSSLVANISPLIPTVRTSFPEMFLQRSFGCSPTITKVTGRRSLTRWHVVFDKSSRCMMGVNWAFSLQSAALLDVGAASWISTCLLNTWAICGVVLRDQTNKHLLWPTSTARSFVWSSFAGDEWSRLQRNICYSPQISAQHVLSFTLSYIMEESFRTGLSISRVT